MRRAVARRLGTTALTLLAVSIVVFLLLNLLPGDPAQVMLGLDARPEAVALLHHRLGLDVPLPLRYARWIGGLLVLQGDTSLTYGVPVAQLLAGRLAVTLPLAGATLLLSVGIGLPVGVAAAARQGHVADTAIMLAAQLFKAIPDFWGGVLLILLFALSLHWLPSGGFPGWSPSPAAAVAALTLPSLALALPQAAILARFTRSATLGALGEEFVRTARAKGLGQGAALWRHAVPSALTPVVTLIGVQFPLLLTGTVIVETVFDLPGLGRLVLEAINGRDLPVVQDLVLLLAGTVALANLAVELLSLWLDPRLADGYPAGHPTRHAAG